MSRRSAGRHFLQIPGPTNVPDRVLRAIDFRRWITAGPDFARCSEKKCSKA
jgi:alanine-glyoxylate transaminase/serine-glyoxylate transaminase/serine-pyruvate transaminase